MQQHPAPATPKPAGQVISTDIQQYPHYYIQGPGRPATAESYCDHGYPLTASCPNCP